MDVPIGELKTVYSAGKQVQFRIPQHWQVEPDGTGMMYFDPAPDSGTLRLSVLNYASPNPQESEEPASPGRAQEMGIQLYSLANGAQLLRYQDKSIEEGDELIITFWKLEYRCGQTIIFAIFSYTLLAEQLEMSQFQEELEQLDREIRKAVIEP